MFDVEKLEDISCGGSGEEDDEDVIDDDDVIDDEEVSLRLRTSGMNLLLRF